MINHYKHKIQNEIQKELFNAKESICIAVAWFTNDLLFQPLMMKLQLGINVELILNHDEINVSEDNEIDFNAFIDAGGKLHWNRSNQLMHDKFCIIDDRIVITGSYNWTNKAEYNNENISVFCDEDDTVAFYKDEFSILCSKYPAEPKPSHPQKSTETNELDNKKSTEIIKGEAIKSDYISDYLIKGVCPGGGEFILRKGKPKIFGSIQSSKLFEEGYLVIHGDTGDFISDSHPWDEFAEQIHHLKFSDGIIGIRAFSNLVNLQTVTIRDCPIICSRAFETCSKLISVEILNLVNEIGDLAFEGCESLKKGTINAKVLGDLAFGNCTGISTILGAEEDLRFNKIYTYSDNHLKLKNISHIGSAFYNCSNLQYASLPSTTQHIGYHAFANCCSLRELLLPDNPNKVIIEEYAIIGCNSIKKIRAAIVGGVDYSNLGQNVEFFTPSKLKEYPMLPGHPENPIEIILIEELPDSVLGSNYNVHKDDVIEFNECPLIIRQLINPENPNHTYRYYVSVLRNKKPSWLGLRNLFRCDRFGCPLSEFQEKMISLSSWTERFKYLAGKKVKGGELKEYEFFQYKDGMPTDEIVKRKYSIISFV